jgi:hypothetical protein
MALILWKGLRSRLHSATGSNCIGPFVELKRAHPERSASMQEQADSALRYFSDKADLKWVSLMLWAGASPQSLGPKPEDSHRDDREYYDSTKRSMLFGRC